MDITVQVLGTCPSGGHIHLELTKDGTVKQQLVIHKSRLLDPLENVELEDAVAVIFRNHIKEQGLTTPLQIKNYLESHTFKW